MVLQMSSSTCHSGYYYRYAKHCRKRKNKGFTINGFKIHQIIPFVCVF